MRLSKAVLFIILYFSCADFVSAQQYKFAHIDITKGLSNNRILCFAEDNNGFIWIGTTSGLNRFDGYNVKNIKHHNTDSTSLSDNMVQNLVKDQLGRLWVLTPKGYSIFNPDAERFTNAFHFNVHEISFSNTEISLVKQCGDSILFLLVPNVGIVIHNLITNINQIVDIPYANDTSNATISDVQVHDNNLYVIFTTGLIKVFTCKNYKLIDTINIIEQYCVEEERQYNLFIDNNSDIWVYCSNIDIGIIFIDSEKKVKHFNRNSNPGLNSNIVANIIQDEYNNYWIGTDHGGLNILANNKKSISYITNQEADKNSLSQNVITSLYKSKNGTIWVGTFKKGFNYYHKSMFRFYHYMHSATDKNSLTYNDVNCYAEDEKGNLWIGTNGMGLIYFNRETNVFSSYKANIKNRNALQSNVIVSLLYDNQKQLWIGTYHGGLSVLKNGKFKNFLHDPNIPTSLSDNRVWDIYEDSKRNLWIGTLGGGLNLFDRDKHVFYGFSGSEIDAIHSNFIMDINEDAKGNIWFGTDNGVFVLDAKTSRFIQFVNEVGNDSSLSENFASKIFIDSQGNIWFGTRNGLNLFNSDYKSFTRFTTKNGLPDNSIMAMLESDIGNYWLSTSGGLCKLRVTFNELGKYQTHTTENYNETDGLQGREFNEGSAFKTSKGELIFGGANGFNLFKPSEKEFSVDTFNTYIVGLNIFGKKVDKSSTDGAKKGVTSSILNGSKIKLLYYENIFSLEFVAVNILAAEKIKYRYKLEGFNDQWIYTSWEDRKATYTNLHPGKYRFIIQSSYFNSEWNKSESELMIIVRPPWYKTWLAYILYLIIVVFVATFARRLVIARERMKYLHKEAERESERQQELNALKTRFFTNVSHEFRTPLTLILTPLERLLKSDIESEARKHLDLMNQNAKRLLSLVNQLLDFRKVEENKLQLNLIYGNIIAFINNIVNSFADYRETQNIKLEFLPEEKKVYMQFDRDKVEKIMMNLLSNAFKFTPEQGNIKVFVEAYTNKKGKELLKIKVEDSGIGISKEDQDKIFERFYQSDLPGNLITKGSGIGLSLVFEFVKLHNGTISVKSEVGKGSKFIVKLPIDRASTSEINKEVMQETVDSEYQNDSDLIANNKKTILLVEDNADFRFYLKDSLQTTYTIFEATNGNQALDIIKNNNVDLVVSDVMMPEIDGFQLCELIKSNADYSHIPVVLLTAKSTQQDKLEGLKQGADEYITKPFNFDILEARIQYLLGLRKKFIKEYQQSFKVKVDDKRVTPLDKKLLDKAMDLINTNISNSEFSVEGMSKELGMSRVYLYKKVSALTGNTPIELIRLVRLKKAAELLIRGELNVSEITYEVGFSDPKYFSKMFKAEFGVLPSKYKESQI